MPNTESIGLVVRSMEINFLDSAKLGDLLEIKTKILKLGRSSVILKQEIFLKEKSLDINFINLANTINQNAYNLSKIAILQLIDSLNIINFLNINFFKARFCKIIKI